MINRLLFILPPVLVVLVLVQFLLSNDLAGTGNSVFAVDQAIVSLREENEILRQQLAVARSLAVVSKRASELGFQESAGFVAVPLQENVALGE